MTEDQVLQLLGKITYDDVHGSTLGQKCSSRSSILKCPSTSYLPILYANFNCSRGSQRGGPHFLA